MDNSQSFKVSCLNCNGMKSSISYVMQLAESHDVLFISEHWLQVKDMNTIKNICDSENLTCFLKSSVDPSEPLLGRPYEGVGFLCKKIPGTGYKQIVCESDRVIGLQILSKHNVVLTFIGVNMPYDNSSVDQTNLYLDTLDQIQCIMDTTDSCIPTIIMGDINTVLPQSDRLPENWFSKRPYSKHSVLTYDFLCENNTCVANFMFDQKVNYTFKRGTSSSYIDHVFIQWHNLHIIKRCDILHDNSDNVSDHFPISFTLDLPLSSQTQEGKVNERCNNSTYPAWDNPTFSSCYSNAVSELMDAIPVSACDTIPPGLARQHVDELYQAVCDAMHESVRKGLSSLPQYRGRKKSWWNRNCTLARDRNKLFHHIWKSSGRPTSGTAYECYKQSRKAYRRCCRQAVHDKSTQTIRLIERHFKNKKSSRLWNLIRSTKATSQCNEAVSMDKLVDHFKSKFSA